MEKRKFKIIAINDWYEDHHMEAGDACHMTEGDVMRKRLEEYEQKVEDGNWPGLPFECMATDENDAVEQYNNAHCSYDYYRALEAELEELHECHPVTLKQVMETCDDETLFRIVDETEDEKVVLNSDYKADVESILEILYPMLDREVSEMRVGTSEDPLSPKDTMPTVWVGLGDKNETGGQNG